MIKRIKFVLCQLIIAIYTITIVLPFLCWILLGDSYINDMLDYAEDNYYD